MNSHHWNIVDVVLVTDALDGPDPRRIAMQHESDLHKLAQALLDRETLTSKEIQDIMSAEKLIHDVHIQQVKLPSAVT